MNSSWDVHGRGVAFARRGLIGLVLSASLGLSGGAQAGPVSGNFDPQFGSFFPNLSYKGDFSFYVPDALVAPGAVVGVAPILGNFSLTLFETSMPGNAVTANFTLNVSQLNFNAGGYLVGFGTNSIDLFDFAGFGPADLGAYYEGRFAFGYSAGAVGGAGTPNLVCARCAGAILEGYGDENVQAGIEGLSTLILHKDDQGDSLLGKTIQGQDLALRSTLVNSETRQFRFSVEPAAANSVPEPTSLALLLAALGGVGLSSRFKRRADGRSC